MRSKHPPTPTAPCPSAPVPAAVATAADGYANAAELPGAAGPALTRGHLRCATTKNQDGATLQTGLGKTAGGAEASLQVFF